MNELRTAGFLHAWLLAECACVRSSWVPRAHRSTATPHTVYNCCTSSLCHWRLVALCLDTTPSFTWSHANDNRTNIWATFYCQIIENDIPVLDNVEWQPYQVMTIVCTSASVLLNFECVSTVCCWSASCGGCIYRQTEGRTVISRIVNF